jgi:hypothetical protein
MLLGAVTRLGTVLPLRIGLLGAAALALRLALGTLWSAVRLLLPSRLTLGTVRLLLPSRLNLGTVRMLLNGTLFLACSNLAFGSVSLRLPSGTRLLASVLAIYCCILFGALCGVGSLAVLSFGLISGNGRVHVAVTWWLLVRHYARSTATGRAYRHGIR